MLKGICTTVAAPLLSVVTGTVQDASTGEAVIGAAVILQNTTYGAVADADGRFVINNVKPGTYTIEVQMLSYQRVVIEGCQIKPGENTLPLISLQPSAEEIDEVVVTTVRRLSSEAAVMQAVRNSKMVVSGVSKQMIARTQDRDAGEVVRRYPVSRSSTTNSSWREVSRSVIIMCGSMMRPFRARKPIRGPSPSI